MPLPAGGYATAVVARVAPSGVALGYFFGPRTPTVPDAGSLEGLRAQLAVLIGKFGDLGILEGTWQRIGRMPGWERRKWPMPAFKRKSPLDQRLWRVEYADDDPNSTPRESLITEQQARSLPDDGLYGDVAIARVLDLRLEDRGPVGDLGHQFETQPSTPGQEGVTYRIYATSKKVCDRVARALQRQGFSVQVEQKDAGSWAIEAVLSVTPPERIEETEQLLSALASEMGATYDGYERGRKFIRRAAR